MLPNWFNKWNRDNPTNIYGPAILVGAVGGAVVVAILLVTWGQPYATTSLQTGPRGTGMSVPEFNVQITRPDPTLDLYYSEPPYVPEGGETLASEEYQNVQVLGDLTVDNFNRLMGAITQWVAPEQGCTYCHGDGDLSTYGEDNLYTKVVSRRMIQMTQAINDDWSGHVNAVGEVGVNCYTCHRGQNVPSEIWFNITPVVETMEGWSAVQNRATSLSQSTSLPSNALEVYLTDPDSMVNVHDLESRVSGVPGITDGVQTIQKTEMTYSLMNYFSNSLGVNCVFCHNSRAFYDPAQYTPQWATAQLGRQMVIDLNTTYLIPLRDTYPPERLGPQGDAPKAACKTCHKGYQRPLQGMNVIADWPELASSDPPEYAAPE
jgi:photosynthetic reaction center cytochrome c subunit